MLQVQHPIMGSETLVSDICKNQTEYFFSIVLDMTLKRPGERRFKTSFFKPTVYLPTIQLKQALSAKYITGNSPNRFLRRKMSALTKNASS